MSLTDGYLTERGKPAYTQSDGDELHDFDCGYIQKLYRYAKQWKGDGLLLERSSERPHPLHLWLVRPSAESRYFANTFQRYSDISTYRILITGEGLSHIEPPYINDWGVWIRRSGFRKNIWTRCSTDHLEFKKSAEDLLRQMEKCFIDTGVPPTAILDKAALQPTFYGDPELSKE